MARPLVSVLMSVYNGERYLRESVESILNQTFTDFEFLIIDDGSRDCSGEIVRSYSDPRIRLFYNKHNVGLTRSLNKGLKLATGEYIARQDADDVSLPERLATQIAYLQKRSHEGLLGTANYVMNARGQYEAIHRHPETDTEIRWQMLFHNAFCHTSVMLRRGLLERQRLLYEESLPYGQDYELWNRVLAYTRAANLDVPMVAWRKNDEAVSTTHHEEQQRIATQISAGEIKRLLPELPIAISDVASLRDWYNAFPRQQGTGHVRLCRQFLKILEAFARQPDVDHVSVKRITHEWIDRTLSASLAVENRDARSLCVLLATLRIDALAVLAHIARRVMGCGRRMIRAA